MAVTALAILSLASCSSTGVGSGTEGANGSGSTEAMCRGPVTATAARSIDPVAENPEPRLPVTYTDVSGSEVTVTDVSRVLALDTYGTLASTAYALGFGDRLVGRDVSTGLPELQDLPVVTHNGHELNGEAILALKPSVIITDYSIGPLEVQMQLRDAGIPVVIMSDQRSRDQIVPQIHEVARVLGVDELGEELGRRVDAEVLSVEAEVAAMAAPDPAGRLRMVLLYMRGTAGVYYWFGKDTGADDLITSLGGVDVAGEAGMSGAQPLNAEALSKSNPDLILMMSEGLRSVGGVEGLAEVPGVAETAAGISGCVVDMDDRQLMSFGPQFPATLRALAEAIYQPGVGT